MIDLFTGIFAIHMSNEHSLLVARNRNIFFSVFFSEEAGNFYCMEDRKLYDALYYYPDNTLGKKELNLEKGQV